MFLSPGKSSSASRVGGIVGGSVVCCLFLMGLGFGGYKFYKYQNRDRVIIIQTPVNNSNNITYNASNGTCHLSTLSGQSYTPSMKPCS